MRHPQLSVTSATSRNAGRSSQPQARRPALRLLIVDDNQDFRSLLTEVLKLKGVKVLEAESGERALQLIEVEAPDAILLDHRMPGLTGTEVVQELRERDLDIPVILMTAADSVEDLADQAGVTHWIGKPFKLKQLQGVLELALGGPQSIRPPDDLDR